MTPEQFAAAGQALYGARWQTQLAQALYLSREHVHLMSKGQRSVTSRTEQQVRQLCRERGVILLEISEPRRTIP